MRAPLIGGYKREKNWGRDKREKSENRVWGSGNLLRPQTGSSAAEESSQLGPI